MNNIKKFIKNNYILTTSVLYILLNLSIHVDFMEKYDYLSFTNSLFTAMIITKLVYHKINKINNNRNNKYANILFYILLLLTIIHVVYLIHNYM